MIEVARQRHARLTPEERTAAASKAATAKWSKMTHEERSEQARGNAGGASNRRGTKAGERQGKKLSPD